MLFITPEIYSTKIAVEKLNQDDVRECLKRHFNGDWGEMDKEDWQANEDALTDGMRIISIYKDRNDNKFYVITEADRSATTILLPEEY